MVARMAKGSVQFFRPGDGVSWVSSRGRRSGVTYTGVVKDGPKGKHNYYEVSTPQGQFKVPAAMLKPAKVKPTEAKALAEKGQKFDERKEANREKRDEATVRDCQISMDIHKFTRGMLVINRGVPGWPKVTVLDVDYAKGKVLVESSTKRLGELASLYGISLRRNTRDSKWVYANRLVPA